MNIPELTRALDPFSARRDTRTEQDWLYFTRQQLEVLIKVREQKRLDDTGFYRALDDQITTLERDIQKATQHD